ncbi:dr1-associated corepressor-like [Saccostrea cucullata]|uniref:dr1-associated corepressor-like n=1 Tax=Saccostrea cuccullata TaxID=36930 RepID=UPI002ED31B88
MPSKKKKFSARFPPARIKKIMQTDEDVGKVAAAVPVLISRALEKFIETLIMKTSETTKTRNAKTLTTSHIKQTIYQEKKFDFLKDLVANVPDHQAEEDTDLNTGDMTKRQKTPRPRKQRTEGRKKRKKNSSESNSEEEENENGSSTETDEESSQHTQLSSGSSNEQHQGIPSATYPNPINSGENPEAMMSYPSTSSMPSHPAYPPPGCYPPQGLPGLPPQGMHNPYSMQMNNHMPQQTQPLNLCNNPSYSPSMYMSSGYPYPPSLGYPYPPHMNPMPPPHESHPGMNHSSAPMPGPSHLPVYPKAPPPCDQGQNMSQSSINPVAPSHVKQTPPNSAEDDDYDA